MPICSPRAAAKAHSVSHSTLYRGIAQNGGQFENRNIGRFSMVFTREQEQKIRDHIKWKASIGMGVTWEMVSNFLL